MPFRFVDRLKYMIERQFVKGALFQLMVVALVIGLISLVGGLLVLPTAGTFADLGDAIWWAFLRLTDPGYLGDDEGSWRRFVSTLLTVSGYVVFMGTLVAILTRSLFALMTDLERGLTPVTMRHHVVVLGWTSRTLPLVRELMAASGRVRRFLERHDVRRMRLVILSESVSAAQSLELRNDRQIGRRSRHIVLRSGSALQPEALHRVAALQAAAIIVPRTYHGPDSRIGADVETVKALMSMASQAGATGRSLPYVVAELEDNRRQPVAERAYPGPLEVIAGDAVMARMMVQTLLHPGLSSVLNELLTDRGQHDLFIRSGENLAGTPFGDLLGRWSTARALGVLRPQGEGWLPLLCPSPEERIQRNDRLVMLARDYDDTAEMRDVARTAADLAAGSDSARVVPEVTRHRVLVLGWNRRLACLLSEMGQYPSHQFTVDVASVLDERERDEELARYGGCPESVTLNQRFADVVVPVDLQGLHPEHYDSVLMLSSDRLASGEEADARTMMAYLQLEEILGNGPDRPQVVMELSDPDNESLLLTDHSETLVSPMIVSHILAQVALRRELRVVLDELFTAGGAEIMLRGVDVLDLPDAPTFATVCDCFQGRGEIALGILWADARRGLTMNPPASMVLTLAPGDRVVVLAHPG
ncbi:Trk K+ transport system NAD-binding subunit [Tamilnaduibacter salinus]|uniref:Trk K+ transport system NAD-binding subunit n=1 Tax=Tamilnaduibacter salinus TaxID=1484056 RepID=A0A2U1CWY9_9GAMM|nr:ion channel DMI1 [Tamilnaduibacter salinus]PVY76487.1 Trk K+ transport system NAD-binding subunit [Tamilnaduibacter salinus]